MLRHPLLQRTLALLLITLLLLNSLSTALSVYAQLPTRVAYLYASDTTARDNFKTFLELQNFTNVHPTHEQ